MPTTPATEASVDRRATPPLPPSVLVVAMLCATLLVLGFLAAAVWMIATGRDLQILLDAVSGPTGLIAIIGQIATLIVVLRVKAQGGRTEALTGRVLPELVRERTAPLEHATPVAPVVVPAPAPGTGQVREVTHASVPFEEVIRPTATLPAQPPPPAAPAPAPAPSLLLPTYPGIPRADYIEDLDAESTHDGIPAHQEVG